MRNLKNAYFKWLYLNINNRNGRDYIKLCQVLYDRPFIWTVPNDDNRCQDGKDLRETFLRERRGAESAGIIDMFLAEDCSVFEVLVGIAKRMDFILYELDRLEKTPKWFEILLKNLELDEFTDDRFSQNVMPEIDRILDIWLNRKYGRNGRGSLFPIKGNSPRDMSRTEIWYQMQAYIQENFTEV